MTHKSRYLPILPAVAALATLVACSDRPPATGPAPGRPEPAATPLTAELQTTSEALAQHLARALTHPAFRAYVKAQLDSSPFREHKLHFQRFLGAHGGHARDEVARHAGVPAGQIDREALAAIPLGLYMTQAHFGNDFEGWLKGAPEFEVHVLGQKGQTDSLTDYQCAGEKQPAPYYFDQNGLDWSGSVMVFSKSQIDAYSAAHPGHNVRVYIVEDDDTACQIKTSADAWKKALDAVDGANQLLTAGKDTTSSTGQTLWKFAKALQKLLSALPSLINTNDELVGDAVQDNVVAEYQPGFNWIVKGENNVTNGWVQLEMK